MSDRFETVATLALFLGILVFMNLKSRGAAMKWLTYMLSLACVGALAYLVLVVPIMEAVN